jgi:iron-sulfur cluster assembly accessory protein
LMMTETVPSAPVLTLTESAATQVKAMLADGQQDPGKILRVYVERGGCSGLQYGLVFDEERPDDIRAEFYGIPVLMDRFSATYLDGAKVDYVDALTGGGFKVINPKARQSCGCGKSFEA